MKLITRISPPPEEKNEVSDEQLMSIYNDCDFLCPVEARDYCMLIVSYKGILRGFDCTSIRQCNFKLLQEKSGLSYIQIILKNVDKNERTKNKKNRTVVIAAETKEENKWKCALHAFVNYYLAVNNSKHLFTNSDFLFFNLAKKDHGKQLSQRHLNFALQRHLKRVNMTHNEGKKSTGHCLRVRGATSAIRNGVQIDLVKEMGGWLSDAVVRYIRYNLQDRIQASLKI